MLNLVISPAHVVLSGPIDRVVTEYYCDLYYDPFKFMRENNKKYGWVMALYEFGMSVYVRDELIWGSYS